MQAKHRPKILVTGADPRQIYAAEKLRELGEVYVYGTEGVCPTGITEISSPDGLCGSADLLVLPITANRTYAVCREGQVNAEQFIGSLAPRALIAGGMISAMLEDTFHSKGFDTADYMKREELLIKNAVPTAEGTLSLIFTRCRETVSGMKILICGWGRTAKACARVLDGVGADVSIAARSVSQRADAEVSGMNALPLDELSENAGRYKVIINTIPALVLTEKVISRTMQDCFIIDLASGAGGTDFHAAESIGRCAVHAPGLPGKHAPVTAGEMIACTVMNIYRERSGSNVT